MSNIENVRDTINTYFDAFPEQREALALLSEQIRTSENILSRKNFRGHVTTSVLLFDEASKEVLLVHHLGLNKWLQPGGHFEDDPALHDSAMRELVEETMVNSAVLHSWHTDRKMIPFDIDTHFIPANLAKNEAAHYHHDCLFLAVVSRDVPLIAQIEEVAAIEWLDRASPMLPNRLQLAINKALISGVIQP